MQIIDVHTHIGKQNCFNFQDTPEELILDLKRSGVTGAVFRLIVGL